jgi:GNAT superfamily N-acetyltransferase
MTIAIRKIRPEDEARWRVLWDGYRTFYKCEPSEALTRRLWGIITAPSPAIHALVAEDPAAGVIGLAHYLAHETTSAPAPVCYLQDLFVDPSRRAAGLGKRMIETIVAEAKRQGWSRVYWHTAETNYRARSLYDKFTPHSGFLRYVIEVPAP